MINFPGLAFFAISILRLKLLTPTIHNVFLRVYI